ncbi:MAG: hypothetical protein HY791_28970 [Deltaproteobacteria bacterium]|nr:hypothetical protein [Deltaproteobacteria bacterium]
MTPRARSVASFAAALLGSFAALLSSQNAIAAEWSFATTSRFFAQTLSEEILVSQDFRSRTSTLTADRLEYQLILGGTFDFRPIDELGVHLALNSGLIAFGSDGVFGDGLALKDHAKRTLFLGRVSADAQLGESGVLELEAGRVRQEIGRGLIYDAYGFGLSADLDFALLPDVFPLRMFVCGLIPDGSFFDRPPANPLVTVELELTPTNEISVALLFAGYFDNGEGLVGFFQEAAWRSRMAGLSEVLRNALGQQALLELLEYRHATGELAYRVDTLGEVAWGGFAVELSWPSFWLSATLLAQLGTVDVRSEPNDELTQLVRRAPRLKAINRALLEEQAIEIGVRAAMFQLETEARASKALSLGGFLALATGDDAELDRRLTSFFGLAPRLGYTPIFFNGGVTYDFATPTVTAVSPDGAGLAAAGLRVVLRPTKKFRAELSGALLAATISNPDRGILFGTEAGVDVSYRLGAGFSASLEFAALSAGSYYGDLPAGLQGVASLSYEKGRTQR